MASRRKSRMHSALEADEVSSTAQLLDGAKDVARETFDLIDVNEADLDQASFTMQVVFL